MEIIFEIIHLKNRYKKNFKINNLKNYFGSRINFENCPFLKYGQFIELKKRFEFNLIVM